MDKVIEKTLELHKSLSSLPEIKEFLIVKSLYENSEELAIMRSEIVKAATSDKEKHEELLKQYHSHPLVNNYEVAREEVIAILKSIKEIIE